MAWRSRESGRRSTALLVAVLSTTPLLAGCIREPNDEALQVMFDEGEYLCLDQRFGEARSLLKAYLMYEPEHAGAHFYLGRAFWAGDDFKPVIAEGELQLALELFIDQGRVSSIERFGDDYFEMICNVESVKVLALQMSRGAPSEEWMKLLERAEMYVVRAEAVMPEVQDVRDSRELVERLKRAAPRELLRPAPGRRPPEAV